jgi:hypothetical protein
VLSVLKKNRERFGYMLNRDEENAGFVDYRPNEELFISSSARMVHFSALAIFSERLPWFRAVASPKYYS